ncbi:MAG: hypothetical protein RL717_2078 [Pseudomonadota bacterium]|jgi:hypothetical protein
MKQSNATIKAVWALALVGSLMPVAHAELVKVFENIRGTTSYVDTASMQGSGQFRKVWELQNYKTASPQGMLSMKMHKEYDCKGELTKMLSYTAYTGRMGTGEEIGTVTRPDGWQSVSKNPGGKGAFRLVCGE